MLPFYFVVILTGKLNTMCLKMGKIYYKGKYIKGDSRDLDMMTGIVWVLSPYGIYLERGKKTLKRMMVNSLINKILLKSNMLQQHQQNITLHLSFGAFHNFTLLTQKIQSEKLLRKCNTYKPIRYL